MEKFYGEAATSDPSAEDHSDARVPDHLNSGEADLVESAARGKYSVDAEEASEHSVEDMPEAGPKTEKPGG